MKPVFLILVFSTFVQTHLTSCKNSLSEPIRSEVSGDTDEDNGGDVVYCRVGSNQQIEIDEDGGKYFSYDYAAMASSFSVVDSGLAKIESHKGEVPFDFNEKELLKSETWTEAMENIILYTKYQVPLLGMGIENYYNQLLNPSKDHRFKPKLVRVENRPQLSTHRLPLRCRNKKNEPNVVQFFIRTKSAGSVNLSYNPEIMKKVMENGDQLSWVLLHEYIWDLIEKNPNITSPLYMNLELNLKLHNKEMKTNFERLDGRPLSRYLGEEGYGIFDTYSRMKELHEKALKFHQVTDLTRGSCTELKNFIRSLHGYFWADHLKSSNVDEDFSILFYETLFKDLGWNTEKSILFSPFKRRELYWDHKEADKDKICTNYVRNELNYVVGRFSRFFDSFNKGIISIPK